MARLLPLVLSAGDLPEPELNAARLDGELFAIGSGYGMVDEAERPDHRGASLAAWLPPRVIAERLTAAWVLGALDGAPSTLELCSDSAARYRAISGRLGALRQVVLDPDDLVTIGGMRVTSAIRTAVDLARAPSRGTDAVVLQRLATVGGFTTSDCIALLDRRRNLPGKRSARLRLERALC